MSRLNRWWLIGVIVGVVAIIVGVLAVTLTSSRDHSDCSTVRAMIEYNTEYNASIEESVEAGDPEGSSLPRYQEWAARLQRYADEIHDSNLARHSDTLAQLADETVGVVEARRADPAQGEATEMPQHAQDYARIAEEFQDSIATLDQACPGGS